jgi:hypothetical protein
MPAARIILYKGAREAGPRRKWASELLKQLAKGNAPPLS